MTTKVQHTPGPWTYDYNNDTGSDDDGFWEWYDVRAGGLLVARVECLGAPDNVNARLISAAPDLLEALEAFVQFNSGHVLPPELVRVQSAARASIEKAKGNQP